MARFKINPHHPLAANLAMFIVGDSPSKHTGFVDLVSGIRLKFADGATYGAACDARLWHSRGLYGMGFPAGTSNNDAWWYGDFWELPFHEYGGNITVIWQEYADDYLRLSYNNTILAVPDTSEAWGAPHFYVDSGGNSTGDPIAAVQTSASNRNRSFDGAPTNGTIRQMAVSLAPWANAANAIFCWEDGVSLPQLSRNNGSGTYTNPGRLFKIGQRSTSTNQNLRNGYRIDVLAVYREPADKGFVDAWNAECKAGFPTLLLDAYDKPVVFVASAAGTITAGFAEGEASGFAATLSANAASITAGFAEGETSGFTATITAGGGTITAGFAEGETSGFAATLSANAATITAGFAEGETSGFTATLSAAPASITAGFAEGETSGFTATLTAGAGTITAGFAEGETSGFAATLSANAATITGGFAQGETSGFTATLTAGGGTITAGFAEGETSGFAATLSSNAATITAGFAEGETSGFTATLSAAPASITAGFAEGETSGFVATLSANAATITAGFAEGESSGFTATLTEVGGITKTAVFYSINLDHEKTVLWNFRASAPAGWTGGIILNTASADPDVLQDNATFADAVAYCIANNMPLLVREISQYSNVLSDIQNATDNGILVIHGHGSNEIVEWDNIDPFLTGSHEKYQYPMTDAAGIGANVSSWGEDEDLDVVVPVLTLDQTQSWGGGSLGALAAHLFDLGLNNWDVRAHLRSLGSRYQPQNWNIREGYGPLKIGRTSLLYGSDGFFWAFVDGEGLYKNGTLVTASDLHAARLYDSGGKIYVLTTEDVTDTNLKVVVYEDTSLTEIAEITIADPEIDDYNCPVAFFKWGGYEWILTNTAKPNTTSAYFRRDLGSSSPFLPYDRMHTDMDENGGAGSYYGRANDFYTDDNRTIIFTQGIFEATDPDGEWNEISGTVGATYFSGDYHAGTYVACQISTTGGTNRIRRSTDGITWTTGLNLTSINETPLWVRFDRVTGYVYAGTTNGLYKSTNDGASYSLINFTGKSVFQLACNNDEVWVWGVDTGTQKSVDGGTTFASAGIDVNWKSVTPSTVVLQPPIDLEVTENQNGTVNVSWIPFAQSRRATDRVFLNGAEVFSTPTETSTTVTLTETTLQRIEVRTADADGLLSPSYSHAYIELYSGHVGPDRCSKEVPFMLNSGNPQVLRVGPKPKVAERPVQYTKPRSNQSYIPNSPKRTNG